MHRRDRRAQDKAAFSPHEGRGADAGSVHLQRERDGKYPLRQECIAAAKAIFADKCIERLPNGYNELLAERGEGLSSGEKQLISFARIVLKNPSVVILDEATSSISSDMEKLIQNALEVMLSGRTSFIVAHRLSTIRSADRILFISNKGIAEEGTHEQLLKQHGLYYNLYKNLNQ